MSRSNQIDLVPGQFVTCFSHSSASLTLRERRTLFIKNVQSLLDRLQSHHQTPCRNSNLTIRVGPVVNTLICSCTPGFRLATAAQVQGQNVERDEREEEYEDDDEEDVHAGTRASRQAQRWPGRRCSCWRCVDKAGLLRCWHEKNRALSAWAEGSGVTSCSTELRWNWGLNAQEEMEW